MKEIIGFLENFNRLPIIRPVTGVVCLSPNINLVTAGLKQNIIYETQEADLPQT
jgi:hypothetical protein